MLKVKLIALSDYASISQEGKLTVAGIFDKLTVAQFPTAVARAFFVATISGDAFTEYKVNLEVKRGSKQIGSFNIDNVTGENGSNNIIMEVVGLPIEEVGYYDFILRQGSKELARTSLEAVLVNNKNEVKLTN